jgi:uncharacterized protein
MITVDQARPYYLEDGGTAHAFDHVLRVTALAHQIAQAEGADVAIVRAAALLHDLASDGPQREVHHLVGAQRALEILAHLGVPEGQAAAVAHCIRSHRFRVPEDAHQTLEAMCLYDADKLDAIGAVGIARAFVHGARLGQPMWAPVSAEFVAGLATGERHSAHHEYHTKLVKIKDRLYTPTGRQIAAGRHLFMAGFFERMTLEIAGLE